MKLINSNSLNLRQLQEAVGNDPKALRLLVKTFIETAPDIYEALNDAIFSNQMEAVRRESHALKGMALLLGAKNLSASLELIERDAASGRATTTAETQLMVTAFARVLCDATLYLDQNH